MSNGYTSQEGKKNYLYCWDWQQIIDGRKPESSVFLLNGW